MSSESILHAEERGIYKFNELLPIVDQETLLIVDIDDTLIFPSQNLGASSWALEQMRSLAKQGRSKQEAFEETCALWKRVLLISRMNIVEAAIPKILTQLQDQGVAILGISKLSPDFGILISDKLRSLNIDLMRTAVIGADIDVSGAKNIRYIEGSLFIGYLQDKIDALIEFLRLLPHLPRKIVYVDSCYKHISRLSQACAALGIAYQGMWYRAADGKDDYYRSDLAHVQQKYFEAIISDEDAQKLIDAGLNVNMEANQ
jgi:hypothetical protein